MKLLLTLLAILTGFVGGDAARAVPAAPSAFGAAITLGEAAGEVRAARQVHRPQQFAPQRYTRNRVDIVRPATAAPTQHGVPSYGLRTRE